MSKPTLSVVLSTRNEEANLGKCLESVKEIADEIVIVDEESQDKTAKIAKKYNAKVYEVKHEPIFHKSKQKAIDLAKGDWILQLDADERVTPELSDEIKKIITLTDEEISRRTPPDKNKYKKFRKHQALIERREGNLGKKTGETVAFFIPRKNYFLGEPLIHAGVYPDGVIRLIKKGKAHFPSKSVHELMEVDGEVGWLYNDLQHHDSPTFKRYLDRANRYTDLTAEEYKINGIKISYWNLFKYSFPIPLFYFLRLYVRHKGFLDGMRGFVWSLFSALHYTLAYFKYWQSEKQE